MGVLYTDASSGVWSQGHPALNPGVRAQGTSGIVYRRAGGVGVGRVCEGMLSASWR